MTHYQKVAEAIDRLTGIYFEHHSERLEALANLLEKEFPPTLKLDCETVPPTVEQVICYGNGIGMTEIECRRFHAFYESNGWKVGKNKMKSWKGALAGWALRREGESGGKSNGNGHPTDAQMIAMTKERERIGERLKVIKGQGSHDAWGGHYDDRQRDEILNLKRRDKELKDKLGVMI
jgi:hypothetical protein